ncbi:MAG: hypothetical protein EOQ31_35630 [Mesorhizobium sp.]|uniref:hypothetical protein n=1 Tax=Mesorhizobium sp. TaxID=1871066 RepID=UPI000FE8D0CB|nr:hypothetical protein [Mesorhizobium sp.]RWA78090.1 MAG: hypothetical protein EOQ31_35630 [Mesorhizobium sp.]
MRRVIEWTSIVPSGRWCFGETTDCARVKVIILELTLEYPAYGQTRIANEMRKLGHSVSPSGVRGMWQRLIGAT